MSAYRIPPISQKKQPFARFANVKKSKNFGNLWNDILSEGYGLITSKGLKDAVRMIDAKRLNSLTVDLDEKANSIFQKFTAEGDTDYGDSGRKAFVGIFLTLYWYKDFSLDINAVWREVSTILDKEYPNMYSSGHLVIASKAGCIRQTPHADVKLSQRDIKLTITQPPLSIIVSLQEGTQIHIYPRSHEVSCIKKPHQLSLNTQKLKTPIAVKTINIPVGSAVCFNQMILHSGSSYESDNVRLFCYLSSYSLDKDGSNTTVPPSLKFPKSVAKIIKL